MVVQYPELQSLAWIDARRKIKASYGNANLPPNQLRNVGDSLKVGDTESAFGLARDLQQPVYLQRPASSEVMAPLQLQIPISDKARFAGVVLAEFSVDGLYRYGVPSEVSARYAVSLLDASGQLLAGTTVPARSPATNLLPGRRRQRL